MDKNHLLYNFVLDKGYQISSFELKLDNNNKNILIKCFLNQAIISKLSQDILKNKINCNLGTNGFEIKMTFDEFEKMVFPNSYDLLIINYCHDSNHEYNSDNDEIINLLKIQENAKEVKCYIENELKYYIVNEEIR